MNQLYTSLYTENGHLKNQFLKLSLLLFFAINIVTNATAQCDANPVANQTVCNNTATTAINFTGTATTFNWVNNTTSIGLAASGTGNIPAFTALNATATGVTATITVTPSTGACTGAPISFTITVNPTPVVNVTPGVACGGVTGIYGTLLTASTVPAPVPGSVSIGSGTINLTVPDNTANGVSNSITMAGVPANATITNISVTLNLPHTYPADMIINLKGPNGEILSLYKHNTNTDNGASSIPTAGFYNSVVSRIASTVFATVPTPFRYGQTAPAGPYKADAINGAITNPRYTIMNPAGFQSNAQNFAGLYTTAASTNGTWTLAMADGGSPGDIGMFSSWTLTIDYTTPGTPPIMNYIWSPLAGLYNDPITTAPYTGTNTPAVYAAPTVYTVYTVTGTNLATGCSGIGRAYVNYTPPAPQVMPTSVNMCIGDPAVKLRIATGTGFNQFCSGSVNIPVPDNNPDGAASSVAVSGILPTCTISGMTVTINMAHTKIGNMVFVLKAPNGTVLNLDYHLGATGGTGATTGFTNTNFSSVGTVALSTGTNPYTGTFKADAQAIPAGGFGATGPTGMLQTVNNWAALIPTSTAANGTWTLGFYDGVTGDVGTLTSWCLGISYSCPAGFPASSAVWTPAAGLFSDPAAAIPYVPGTPRDSVWARPTPSGVYPYQVTTQSTPGPAVIFSNPAIITIPVGGAAALYPSNITVSGLPLSGVKISSVILNGVSHTRSSDIDVVLQSPSGQNVILMSDMGGTNAINATYTFMDWAPFMNLTTANPGGTYSPSNNGTPDNFPAPGPGSISNNTPLLNTFTGNYNGTWKLFVVDDDGTGDQGAISGGYTIVFDTVQSCTSLPRTVVVTVSQPTTITQQPVAQSVCVGTSASFTVGIAGTGPFTYQWQGSGNGGITYNDIVNGGVFSGALTNTLLINAPPVTMNGNLFRVLINGGSGCSGATSAAALLTVNPQPNIVITANPLIIGPTQTTTILSAVIPNPAATYTWYYNSSVLPAEVSANLLVNYGYPGDYQLKVTDVNGCSNFSNILTIANSFALNLTAQPNPSSGRFTVTYYSGTNNAVQRTMNIFNNKGDKVMTKVFTQTLPYQKVEVDIREKGKGIYWVELVDGYNRRIAMNKVVVQ